MGVIAFGFGVLLAANRVRREAREASVAPTPAQLGRIVREFRHEIMALGEITSQPLADARLFAVLAARLAGSVADDNTWASLDAALANFTALFAPDFVEMVDDLYAAAFDPFGNDSETTQATFNVCDAAWAALEEAGYGAAPRRVARAS
jgi:hypothetical protein